MKTPQHRIGNLLGILVLGSWMASPALLVAQEAAPRPGPPPAPRQGKPPEGGPHSMHMNRIMREVMELHRAGKHDEARQLVERARGEGAGKPWMDRGDAAHKPLLEEQRPERGAPTAKDAPPRVRIQHLKQAAEHLQAAGFEEMADRTRKEIGRIEEQARRESGGDQANDAMREEMKKLRREMEDMRNQLRKLKAEAAPKHEPAPEHKQD